MIRGDVIYVIPFEDSEDGFPTERNAQASI
jgi:hypothetical protein